MWGWGCRGRNPRWIRFLPEVTRGSWPGGEERERTRDLEYQVRLVGFKIPASLMSWCKWKGYAGEGRWLVEAMALGLGSPAGPWVTYSPFPPPSTRTGKWSTLRGAEVRDQKRKPLWSPLSEVPARAHWLQEQARPSPQYRMQQGFILKHEHGLWRSQPCMLCGGASRPCAPSCPQPSLRPFWGASETSPPQHLDSGPSCGHPHPPV